MRTIFVVLASLAWAAPAWASCRIYNETDRTFLVSPGDETGRELGPHTEDSLRSGDIIIEGNDGAALTGFCSEGGRLVRLVRGPRGG
jgi:hypothetical protein